MKRRDFLACAAAVPFVGLPKLLMGEDGAVAPVPALDAARIKPSDFSDADLDMPFALSHFARVANSVVLDGPTRGFIDISVWRGTNQLHPYNARIMESILTLTWFYTAARSWNPYRGNPAVRARLELAFDFWCNSQSGDGKFSEYGPQEWNLAATSFAVKFISEALRLLKGGPGISESIHARAVDACRKAVHAVLFDPEFYSHGCSFSNQYTNIFAGGAAFLALYPDTALSARLRERLEASPKDMQSPAGYMYEADGPDLGYTLNTHHENLQMAYSYWRGTDLGNLLVEEENRFSEWLSFNALPEPGTDFFVLNRGIETRQKHATYPYIDTPLAERCVMMRAFATTPERRREQIRDAREKLNREWPQVAPLAVGEFSALSPYRFLQRASYEWHPMAEQIAEARKMLRPVNEQSFVKQLRDTRKPIAFTYVRRPGYYAAFASAPKAITEQERLGLTLVWSPTRGVLMQSQTSGSDTAWGTSAGGASPVEATGLEAEYSDGGAAVRYPLAGGGEKSVMFGPESIRVAVKREGEIVERVPVFDPKCVVSSAPTVVTAQPGSPVPGKSFFVVELKGTGRLEYEIRPGG